MKIFADHLSIRAKNQIFDWTVEILAKNYCISLLPPIVIGFSNRLKSRFGNAYIGANWIEISTPIWKRARIEQKRSLIKHEVAHLIAAKLHGFEIEDHGKEWREVMLKGGEWSLVYHTVDCTGLGRKMKKFLGFCSCHSHLLSHQKMKDFQNGFDFRCSACDHLILPTGEKIIQQTY